MVSTKRKMLANSAQWKGTPEHEAIRQAREHVGPHVYMEQYEIQNVNFESVHEAEQVARLAIGRLLRLGDKGPVGLPFSESEFCKYRDLMMDASEYIKENEK